MTLVLAQLALLLFTAWGWGFWVWRLSGATRLAGGERYRWFFFGLGGHAACILFLHALIYFDLPLKWTSWVALSIAVMGAAASWLTRRRAADTLRSTHRREALAGGLVFAVIFLVQGAPLFHAGPRDYYGNAHTDQVNYVLLAEFLIEKPFGTVLSDVHLQPWLAKPLLLKAFRLGQSVSNGYLAVVSHSDAKGAYGTLSIFMVGLGALSVFVLARVLSVPRALAILLGIWWGVLPAVTKMHLDGFFSQTCVIFVFPASAALCRLRRGRIEAAPFLLLALYLAYLLCAYTEVYVLGLGLVASLVLLAAAPGTRFGARTAAVAAVAAGSLLLTGGYAIRFVHFAVTQYQVAASPTVLADLVPMSGTWTGWKQIFFGYEPTESAVLARVLLLSGLGVVGLGSGAFQGRSLLKRRFLLAMIAPALGVLALLLSAPELPKYPFSKLLDTFTTFWLVLAVLGLLYVARSFGRRRLLQGVPIGMVGVMTLAALGGSWPQWQGVWNDQGILAAVDSPAARRCYAVAETHPSDVYVVSEPHNLLCAWLCYAARRSSTYVDAAQITDLLVPPEIYAFRRVPPLSGQLVLLGAEGPKRLADHPDEPDVVVRNPQGVDGGGANTWYWIGHEAAIDVTDYAVAPAESHRVSLEFNALAGPANPSPARELALVGPAGDEQKLAFSAQSVCHFLLDLHPGKNVYTLKVLSPEQTVRLPADPRDVMVRIDHLTLGKPAAATRDPAPAATPPSS